MASYLQADEKYSTFSGLRFLFGETVVPEQSDTHDGLVVLLNLFTIGHPFFHGHSPKAKTCLTCYGRLLISWIFRPFRLASVL